ncbi:MAG: V-type ATP synthase subunit K [Oscillospiraceae bacterium]|jgi:V/A-type H+-transporting ATPase subunit K
MFSNPVTIVYLGIALAATLPCIGSAWGVHTAGKAAAGVVSEKPELFGKLLVIQALPGTQGIYGFLTAVLILVRSGILSGSPVTELSTAWTYFASGLTIAFGGLFSAIYQGSVAASAVLMTAKQPNSSGRGITMTALVETYAILSLLVSILTLFSV